MPDPALSGRAPASPIGWFGKLPALGDFAARRLPDEFVGPWDRWLQQGLAHSRHRLGDAWTDLYLTFPVWRFVVPASLLGARGWAGVLMPSVDRVGRCYPLTICSAFDGALHHAPSLAAIEAGMAPMIAAGLAAVDGEPLEAFEARLEMGLEAGFAAGLDAALAAGFGAGPDAGLAAGLKTRLAAGDAAGAAAASNTAGLVQSPTLPFDALLRPTDTGAWPLHDSLAAAIVQAAREASVSLLGRRTLWWTPPDDERAGAVRLEAYPFDAALMTRLIGES